MINSLKKASKGLKLRPNRLPSTCTWSWFSSSRNLVLGIETSCDDTGCAVIDTNGTILGESLISQQEIHLKNGGIIPPIAQDLHRKNIETVVQNAIKQSGVDIENIDAIAATVKPGLPLSLTIGTKYGKYLCRKYEKPFIPIHHMEAHALAARLEDQTINFPFLVLLISGGHCLIAVVEDVDSFYLLGESIDDAPGEAFDKIARRMKLRNLPEYSNVCGGRAIELAASKADDPLMFKFTIPLLQLRNCNFSLSGIKTQTFLHVESEERRYNVPPDGVIPSVNNLCAGFQMTLVRHLCHRVQRAMEFVSRKEMIPASKRTLVVSGGVACNDFIAEGLQIVCDELDYRFVRPSHKLCTDNGVMIAWNGVEKWNRKIGIFDSYNDIDIEKTAPLGKSLIEDVKLANLACKWVRLTKLVNAFEKERRVGAVK